jgi:hypothetical protein
MARPVRFVRMLISGSGKIFKKQGRTLSARPLYEDTLNYAGWNDGGPAQRQGFHRSLSKLSLPTELFFST